MSHWGSIPLDLWETLNHAWECLTQGRGELGYGPSISHRACHWPRGTPQYINLCPCETGLGPGTLWCSVACPWMHLSSSYKIQRNYTGLCTGTVGPNSGSKDIKKGRKKHPAVISAKSKKKKKRKEENLGVGSKNRVLFMPSALTVTKDWANHLRHPSSKRLDSLSSHRSLSSPPSLESKQGNLSYLF